MCATTTERPRRPAAACAAVGLAAGLLAGCGGGVFIGVGPDDDPPRVELGVSTPVAAPGQPITLFANASDDFGIDYVAFYRLEPGSGTAVRLGVDAFPPYQLVTAIPAQAFDPEQFFARAVDGAGQFSDSTAVAVRVLP